MLYTNTLPDGAGKTALVVDLDNTLLHTDILYEQLLKLIKARPWFVTFLPYWISRGPTLLKARLASLVVIDPERLPYRQEIINAIHKAKQQGCVVMLASAAHDSVVQAISTHLGLFDKAIGTSTQNIKGSKKLRAILESLGGQRFTYAGDSRSDLAIWRHCDGAIAINPTRSVERSLLRMQPSAEVLHDKSHFWRLVIKQMRVHQWVKNALIFLPLMGAHDFTNPNKVAEATAAGLSFSLLASAVYVMNDLFDIDADRRHKSKRSRPFASGQLSLRVGLTMFPLLVISAATLAAPLGGRVTILLACYLAVNILYSLKLKELIVIDTVILSGFYTLRILVGGAATDTWISPWLLGFSVFFFFGLAMVKRYTEIHKVNGDNPVSGRGYLPADRIPVFALGAASSMLSILVFVMYLNGSEVQHLYKHPMWLWAVLPMMLYWVARLWMKTHRGEILDDPVTFSIKDAISWAVGITIVFTTVIAT